MIRFELRGRSRRYFWLVLRSGEASLCPEHPGFAEDVFVTASPANLYLIVLGKYSLEEAIAEGIVQVEGPPAYVRSLPKWLILRRSGPTRTRSHARSFST